MQLRNANRPNRAIEGTAMSVNASSTAAQRAKDARRVEAVAAAETLVEALFDPNAAHIRNQVEGVLGDLAAVALKARKLFARATMPSDVPIVVGTTSHIVRDLVDASERRVAR
jgi:hypothetical protein